MTEPIDIIVKHHSCFWKHISTGQIHLVIWASPFEVITSSEEGSWRGKAVQFISEFEALL